MINENDEEQQPLLRRQTISAHFGVTAEDLMRLVDPKNPDLLQQLGGVDGVCRALSVDPHVGLPCPSVNESDKEVRRSVFGTNTLPEPKRTRFWQLLLNAYNDKTLSKTPMRYAHQCRQNGLTTF